MKVNQDNIRHFAAAQTNFQPIHSSLAYSAPKNHSPRNVRINGRMSPQNGAGQTRIQLESEQNSQLSSSPKADRYISEVRDRLTQISPDTVHHFDRALNKALSKVGGSDEPTKTNAVDSVLNGMAARGEISQDFCAELKALNPSTPEVKDTSTAGLSNTVASTGSDQVSGAAIPSSDTATDFATNDPSTKSSSAIKTAQPAAAHSAGIGGLSGPEMPNPTFLWKPSSDSDGNLVILLPAEMTGQVSDVEVLSPDGKTVLAKGKYTGAGNGMREHYRFGKPGASFPPGSIVKVTMANGAQKEIKVPNPGSRMESK